MERGVGMFSKRELERLRKEGGKYVQERDQEEKQKKLGLPYKAGGIQVKCPHCRHDEFLKGEALLNTKFLTFLDWDWLDDAATTLCCTKCGFIQWFGKGVEAMEGES